MQSFSFVSPKLEVIPQALPEKRMKVQRKWLREEEKNILQYMINTISQGKEIEKPTAEKYYEELLNVIKIPCCSVSQLKNKVKHLKQSYVNMVHLRPEHEQDASYQIVVRNRCPHFNDLAEIYSRRDSNSMCVVDAREEEMNQEAWIEDSIQVEEENTINQSSVSTSSMDSDAQTCLKRFLSNGFNKQENEGYYTFAETRKRKVEVELKRLKLEEEKLEFEKEKWRAEVELRNRQLDLDLKKIELEKYEIEIKYKTQLEIAKISRHKQST